MDCATNVLKGNEFQSLKKEPWYALTVQVGLIGQESLLVASSWCLVLAGRNLNDAFDCCFVEVKSMQRSGTESSPQNQNGK